MSSKQVSRNTRTEGAREFVKILQGLAYGRSTWSVFEDWVTMAATSIYNQLAQDPAMEEAYLECAKRYDAAELKAMGELLGIAQLELLQQPRDFLGEVYEAALLANANHGQFFTPWAVSMLLARLNLGQVQLAPDKILTIAEPACGAGGMVLAACQILAEQGINYAANVFIEAQDIDPTCARMTYIQLSLIGAAAVIVCGDTLRVERKWAWATPAYVLNRVGERLDSQRRVDAMREVLGLCEPIEQQASVEFELPRPAATACQLELFEVGA
jgi:hypothetical protein